jgi:hypothetical protein
LFPQDHKATFKTLMVTEANVGEVKACVRESIAELGKELLLRMETCKEWEANRDKLVNYWKGKES